MRKLKNFLSFSLMVFVIGLCFSVASCSKDNGPETPDTPDNPNTPVNPDKPVADPANTVTVNLLSGQTLSSDTSLGEGIYVYVDAAHNLCITGYNELIDYGEVAGLGNVTTIPNLNDGWKSKTAMIVGHGYVIRNWSGHYFTYARLYVADTMISTSDAIMGYTVKYECPMTGNTNALRLESYYLELGASGDLTKSIKIESGTGIEVTDKPDWCEVEIKTGTNPEVVITAEPNPASGWYSNREGHITLVNATGRVNIRVIQQGN